MINREDIVNALERELKNNDTVYALWLEGSDANDTADEYSDIDIWIDVEDAYIKDCILVVEQILASISDIDFMHDMRHSHPEIEQKIYHLKDTSEFLMIDLCWQLHSREKHYFTIGDTVENAKVIFDRADVIGFKEADEDKDTQQFIRLKEMVAYRFSQDIRVLKYVYRGQYLEALYAYNEYVLHSLVKFLRGVYTPEHTDYELLHISNHLPKEHADKLIYFGRIASLNDIEVKTKEAKIWFEELLEKYN